MPWDVPGGASAPSRGADCVIGVGVVSELLTLQAGQLVSLWHLVVRPQA